MTAAAAAPHQDSQSRLVGQGCCLGSGCTHDQAEREYARL
jgi:hypothetical protein